MHRQRLESAGAFAKAAAAAMKTTTATTTTTRTASSSSTSTSSSTVLLRRQRRLEQQWEQCWYHGGDSCSGPRQRQYRKTLSSSSSKSTAGVSNTRRRNKTRRRRDDKATSIAVCDKDGGNTKNVSSASPNKPIATTITTGRDLLRQLAERNVLPRKRKSSILSGTAANTVDDALAVAQARMEYLRNALFEYWGGSAKAPTTATKPQPRGLQQHQQQQQRYRTKGPALKMDGRWWAWNVAFALLPAVVIGGYCEFFGQYSMYEFHRRELWRQMERALGEEYCELHREALQAKSMPPPPEHFFRRAYRVAREIRTYLLGFGESATISDGDNGDYHQKGKEEDGPLQFSAPAQETTPSKVTAATAVTRATTAPSTTTSGPSSSSLSPSVEELRRRVRELETTLERLAVGAAATASATPDQLQTLQKQRPSPPSPSSPETTTLGNSAHSHDSSGTDDYQRTEQFAQKSGIQNRMEGELVDAWLREVEEYEQERQQKKKEKKKGKGTVAPRPAAAETTTKGEEEQEHETAMQRGDAASDAKENLFEQAAAFARQSLVFVFGGNSPPASTSSEDDNDADEDGDAGNNNKNGRTVSRNSVSAQHDDKSVAALVRTENEDKTTKKKWWQLM